MADPVGEGGAFDGVGGAMVDRRFPSEARSQSLPCFDGNKRIVLMLSLAFKNDSFFKKCDKRRRRPACKGQNMEKLDLRIYRM